MVYWAFIIWPEEFQLKNNENILQNYKKLKQAMVTLGGMVEQRFSNNLLNFVITNVGSILCHIICCTFKNWNMLWQDILKLICQKKVNNDDDSLACLYKCKFVFDKKKKYYIANNCSVLSWCTRYDKYISV